MCQLHSWVGAGIPLRDVIRLQGTSILLSFFNLPFNRPVLDSVCVSILGQCWVFWAWGYTAHTGSDTSFSQCALAVDGAGLTLGCFYSWKQNWDKCSSEHFMVQGEGSAGRATGAALWDCLTSKVPWECLTFSLCLDQEQHHLQVMPQPGLEWHRSPTRVTSASTGHHQWLVPVSQGPCAGKGQGWERCEKFLVL